MKNLLIDQVPLFQVLQPHKNILLAGAGGGFDIYSGLPLYFRLKALGHQVWLANLSFTQLGYAKPVQPDLPMVQVGPDTDGPTYFPEKYLARWLTREEQPPETVYALKRTGVQPLKRAYRWLVEQLDLDAIVLIDGGTDSLLRGDEDDLGTPSEDLASIAAVHDIEVPCKILTSIGFGIDTFHGVCHHHFLESVAALTKRGHFLGAFSLLPNFEETQLLRKVADYVFTQMPEHISIVLSSILHGVEGEFGDFHATWRTKGSELFINPLMGLYWSFYLDGVAERCLYLDRIKNTHDIEEVIHEITRFRGQITKRPWKELPV